MGTERKLPRSAEELLLRYAAGEREFVGADIRDTNAHMDLRCANLGNAKLRFASLMKANFSGANLSNADLMGSNLDMADLSATDLTRAALANATLWRADLRRANLAGAELYGANLSDANLDGATLDGAGLADTSLVNVDLAPFCAANPPVEHLTASHVDFRSVVKSLHAPNLKEFLQRAGMPEVFIEYMVECAQGMDGSLITKLLQTTFIGYGGADESMARRLYEALHRNGVTTFFHAEHAKPGQKIHRMIRENIENYDRILVLCSKESLAEPRVLQAVDECLAREARVGGAEYLIPIELDDCLREDGAMLRKDLVRALRDRVCADFRGAHEDEAIFQAGLRKLIAALRPPDLALWRLPASPKPTDP